MTLRILPTLTIGDRIRSIPFGVTGTIVRFDETFDVYVAELDEPMSRIGQPSLTTLTVTPTTVEHVQ